MARVFITIEFKDREMKFEREVPAYSQPTPSFKMTEVILEQLNKDAVAWLKSQAEHRV